MPKTNPLKEALLASEPSSPAAPPRPARGPADQATKLVGARFPEEVHRQVRVLAASEGRTVHSIIAEALNDLFGKKKLPPIA